MKETSLSSAQAASLVLLRMLIGWHFLYEGVLKLYNPAWSAKGYLLSAQTMKPLFTWLGGESMVGIVDAVNVAGLLFVGAALLLGVFARAASIGGIVLLLLYYIAHPPFPSLPQGPVEGSYWVVNKNLIEAAALYALYHFPTSGVFGLERLWKKRIEAPAN